MVEKNNGLGAREIGLLMLGGVLLLALIALHFYVTEVLPHTGGGGGFGAYCQSWDRNTVVVTVNSYGEHIKEANVYMNDKLACQLKDIPPNSSDVCKASVEGNVGVYRVMAATSSGKKLKDAGVCAMYGAVKPAPVRID